MGTSTLPRFRFGRVVRRRPTRLIQAGLTIFALFLWWDFYWGVPEPPKVAFVPSSFDWSATRQHHPPGAIKPLPIGKSQRKNRIQAPSSRFKQTNVTDFRRNEVREAFIRGYYSYKEYAWMKDELTPLTAQPKNTFGGWAATLVDSLDTMWIMGLDGDFYEGANHMATLNLNYTTEAAVNVFETNIRHLGGLLSAYELSREPALLHKAHEMGEILYVAFDTPNRFPGFWLNFEDALAGRQVAGLHDPLASPGSLCLEFTRLSQLTGDPKFYDATDRIMRFLEKTQGDTLLPGMWPAAIDFQNELVNDNFFTLGALADSMYEYLPKMDALLGGRDRTYEKMYRAAMDTVSKHLLFRPMVPEQIDILFAGDVRVFPDEGGRIEFNPESQHLTCFVGGMFALGGKLFDIAEHVTIGEQIARGCAWAYNSSAVGVMPEIFNLLPCPDRNVPCEWDEARWRKEGDLRLAKGFKDARDPRYLLRPEAIESIFIMYRLTADQKWQDIAWDMFQSIMAATKTDYANAGVEDVTIKGGRKINSMESFWFSETLKYFFLIFAPPDLISLDDFVFSTEAHPFRRS